MNSRKGRIPVVAGMVAAELVVGAIGPSKPTCRVRASVGALKSDFIILFFVLAFLFFFFWGVIYLNRYFIVTVLFMSGCVRDDSFRWLLDQTVE